MREQIDFHAVRFEHEPIHERLLNWARWANPAHGGAVLAMFRFYQPYLYPREHSARIPIDGKDAVVIQKTFHRVPAKNRDALAWYYVYPYRNVHRMCRDLAVNQEGLHALIHDGRAMMRNLAVNSEKPATLPSTIRPGIR